ncbi:endonuclease domain-containing protein [Tessaracoccus sp. G1721]
MRQDIRILLEEEKVINASTRPELARTLNALRCRGELTAVLPAIFALPDKASEFETRVAAAAASTRPYIAVGRTAARATWWPELEGDVVSLAHQGVLDDRSGFEFHERYIPPALVNSAGPLPLTSPALTVLDLIPELGPDVVDEALRRRVVTLGHLQAALAMTPRRRGNRTRREVLLDSRDAPWSALERLAHRTLREARIPGWVTNFHVDLGPTVIYLDIAWPQLKVAVEIDGFEFHGSKESFHADRKRDAALTAAGWLVLRFSSETIVAMPDAVQAILRDRR